MKEVGRGERGRREGGEGRQGWRKGVKRDTDTFIIGVLACHMFFISLSGYQYGRIPWADADITVLVDEKGIPKFCLQELVYQQVIGHTHHNY